MNKAQCLFLMLLYKTLFANSYEFVPFLITSSRDLEDFTEQGIKIAFNNRYLVSEQ